MNRSILRNAFLILVALMGMLKSDRIMAQQTTGTPGSPSATKTIDGKYLPAPEQPFGGVINMTAPESKPFWPSTIVPPKAAPNILLIMTDDQGYGVSGTFGGVVPTPAMDMLAKSGLRYTQFHSTALCSPTRAALITGRNHHSVGFGVISEMSTGYPGYNSLMGPESATIGEILKDNGYATSWFGKNHNTPSYQLSDAGPFNQWPVGMGFEYFYGFMGGETDQWTPYLFQNTSQIFPWVGKPDYNLGGDLADNAIDHMQKLKAAAPEKPFFVYFVPGGTHSPHQPPKEWIEKFKGKFDMGWNAMREQIYANQKKLGVIPEGTQLTPWPKDVLPMWESLTADEKKLYAHEAEVFAAYAAYTDHEIGRVIQSVRDMGEINNTIIIYISGDNGTSAEGTLQGTFNQMTAYNGILDLPIQDQLKLMDAWGSDQTYPHMSVAWSWAFDCPFKWTKQVASHFGGTRQGMVISWPGHIKDTGAIRTQFHHMIDIVPTLLEVSGIPAPVMVNGIAQKPIEGVSMAYTFNSANAKLPSIRKTQYFEMFGNRAIYHDGWVACTTPPAAPWLMGTTKLPEVMNGYKWELYNIANDFSENNDLSAKNPDKLREMQQIFIEEATKYNVFPMDNSIITRLITPRPSAVAGRTLFTYSGEMAGLPASGAPSTLNKSYTITADITVPQGGGDGMINTEGGRFGGYGLYILKGIPVFTYNLLDLARFRLAGKDPLSPGTHTIVFDFVYDGPGVAKGGTGTLKVDGKEVSTLKIPKTIPFLMTIDETFDVGIDLRTGVNDEDYKVPFKFTGKVNKLTINLGEDKLTESEHQEMQRHLAMVNN
jgi:arylsulfatase A-like enzyme